MVRLPETFKTTRMLVLFGVIAAAQTLALPAFAIGPGGGAKDLGSSVSRMAEGRRVLAPFAASMFCAKYRDQCVDNGGADVVELDAGHRAELERVNLSVNRAIKPVNDSADNDSWDVDVARGDCEDFALTKRKQLIALGWPVRAVRIAVARTPWGEGHAVVVVSTSQGDLILDNRHNQIKPWRNTDLQWVMVQAKADPKSWVALSNSRRAPDSVAAGR